jgi:hypothetical protein
MKGRRRPIIEPRIPMFLGCEGESEQGYGTLIARLLIESRESVYLRAELLRPGGGDPLALVECAIERIAQARKTRGTVYAVRGVLLDSDTRGVSQIRDQQAVTLADENGIMLIWQDPCFEAVLLRHLDGCHALRPQTCAIAMTELRRRWPDYAKGLPAADLARRISRMEIERCAGVESELAAFLRAVGFLARSE